MLAESICEKNHTMAAHPPEYETAGARTQSPSERDKEGNIIVTESCDITKDFSFRSHRTLYLKRLSWSKGEERQGSL